MSDERMVKAEEFPAAERVQLMEASSTMAVLQAAERLRAAGQRVLDLGAGEPDFPTPEHIKEAARRALAEDFTRYTPAAGIAELRATIARVLNERFGSTYTPEQVIVTAGGKQAIFNAIVTLIEPGDEVLIPAPYWVTFPQIVTFAGGRNVIIPTEMNAFRLTAEMVEEALTPRAKLLILNSPNNPTGRVIPPAEFERIVELVVQRGCYVLSDECYREFVYPPHVPFSAASLPEALRERVLLVGSFSKTYAMTGWRIGYAVGPLAWIREMIKVQSHSTSNPTSISQKAALEALVGPQDSVARMLREYQRRRDFVVEALNGVPGIRCGEPEGAFYVFPDVRELMRARGVRTSRDLEARLLEECQIALTAGVSFGTEGYVRISYATSFEVLQEAVARLLEFARAQA
ncbi:MAG: pyridoxal phosphate-dependent aminotransferase [Blastocatellia bacterium]|nr:pyridoxal phosphate-dependent aminotransferase [Blastocatellia bacterium]MCS7158402.1 pyridoxal phosphate-dependent aminotransferase [Blastocatellia bacterium]MCX7752908.1 pyridoxal phosphate-dependent aminotransferase [Blastocatellia bacterium]MDW8167964.1 pyridoxal phosphate-dependent aminotransferase [Acidobacteriota bacterium]MDW8256339.1 pyridoxal phosphate-dependent aminotransferase [Acidobacteriota bacterium]